MDAQTQAVVTTLIVAVSVVAAILVSLALSSSGRFDSPGWLRR